MSVADRAGHSFITRRSALLGLAASSATFALARSAHAEDEWGKIVDGAKKEGRVVLYSAFVGSSSHQTLKREFQAAYGITVDILEARASEVRERIRIEHTAGRFVGDVSENGRTTTTLQIAQDNVFDPHGPLPSLDRLKPEFKADDIRVPSFAIVYGIIVNTRIVKPEDEPKTWADLLDPRWKSKMLSDDFRALGGGGVLFYVLYEKLGQPFLEKLATQDIKFSREIPANQKRIARGEMPLYLPVSMTSIPELKGLPVKFIAPKEGMPYIGYDLALLKNAPHPNAARLLMEYCIGQKMQQTYANLGLLPVTTESLGEIDETIAELAKSKLLGTTDATKMEEMLARAKTIFP
ncbi:ABC transporter substrate-binding protein [soil metagenome]